LKPLGNEELPKSAVRKLIHLITVSPNLIGNQQTLQPLGCLTARPRLRRRRLARILLLIATLICPSPIPLIISTCQGPHVILELALFCREVVHPRLKEFQMFFQVRIGAQIQPVEGGIGPVHWCHLGSGSTGQGTSAIIILLCIHSQILPRLDTVQ